MKRITPTHARQRVEILRGCFMIRLKLGVISGWTMGFYATFRSRLVNKRGGERICSLSSVSYHILAGYIS